MGPSGSSRGEVTMSDFPTIKSTHSLVAKYVTKPIWDKLSSVKTATSGFTLGQAIACAVEFDNQHCGIYAGDWDSYKDFAEVFDPLIQEYHGISADATHTSDMDVNKIKGNVDPAAPGAPGVNLVARPVALTISLTSTGWDTLRS